MSREVRRVPLDWQHPTTHNQHWELQTAMLRQRDEPPSRLHGPTERFVGLFADYPAALADWERKTAELTARSGRTWDFNVEYHLTGQIRNPDAPAQPRPFYVDEEETVTVRDEDHLQELALAENATEKPDPAHYMPTWTATEQVGWCLYETVTEGTPVTPVFATAAELIDHLATAGQDWDQVPLRRASAEAIVNQGSTYGSMVGVGGTVLNSTTDADILAARTRR